ncbi:hypothetical protein LWI29_035636 [Acer saccharum]|uniref:FAS1 domain-containing protein n=1 Tax=Acer saccharum TaxID=4024 RepID=A0AA39VU53_ACESA|nr:hypothetical protein LWI29_035636 [Acer saccharum]
MSVHFSAAIIITTISLLLSFSPLSEFLLVRDLESLITSKGSLKTMDKMEFSMVFIAMLVLCSTSNAQKVASPPTSSPTPAPAPAPGYVNLTDLLTVAGPFHTFLSYLQSTKVLDTFQSQANNTDEGITIFVPKDDAFKSQKNPSLSNLTQDQIKQLILYHALPHYYSLANFQNLSQVGPVNTFAGGDYTLNFTDDSGTIHLNSGWTRTKVTSSVHSTDPVALYQVDKVLLPESIFGTDIPPMPAPAPAPDVAPTADSPSDASGTTGSSPKSSTSNSSQRIINWGVWTQLALAVSGWLVLFL